MSWAIGSETGLFVELPGLDPPLLTQSQSRQLTSN